MDAISRALWWGHDVHTRKMFLLNWDKICRSRREGGLGLKKFSIMNQAMLAKQYWRISQSPLSLISKIFKAKYFPHSTIHECIPKPYHSWFWRGIITPKNKKLQEGRWIIGSGSNVPLSHKDWFPCQTHVMEQHNLSEGIVADLIDSVSHAWKPNLVRALYPGPISQEVLRLPISKTGSISNRLVWRHSSSGDY